MSDSAGGAAHPGRRWLLIGLLAACALVVVLFLIRQGVSNGGADSVAEQRVGVTEFVPQSRKDPIEITGTTIDGTPLDLADLRGQPLVLNVWGSWCAPCRQEAPALKAVSAEFDGRVAFVGIDVLDNPSSARAFERTFGIQYPSLDDSSGAALLSLRETVPPKAVPSTVVLDKQGRVAARVVGVVRAATLRALIRTVLAEPATP